MLKSIEVCSFLLFLVIKRLLFCYCLHMNAFRTRNVDNINEFKNKKYVFFYFTTSIKMIIYYYTLLLCLLINKVYKSLYLKQCQIKNYSYHYYNKKNTALRIEIKVKLR